ncbi:ABC transporter permease [Flavitalea flava]
MAAIPDMLKNFFIIGIRHLIRHKLFSLINIFCLAIGITFSLIIGVYVIGQEKVNGSLSNVADHYLIKSNWKVKDMGLEFTTFGPLAQTIKEEYPRLVRNYYRYNPVATAVSVGNEHYKENIAIGDTTLVTMYGFPVLYGNKDRAFSDLNSAVITESEAQKLFGKKNALGLTFSMETTLNGEEQIYRISAVLRDISYNSVTGLIGTNYNIFVPSIGNRFYQGGDPAQSWGGAYEIGLIELQPGVRPKDLEVPFKQTLAKYTKSPVPENLTVELASINNYYIRDNNASVQKMIATLSLIAFFILVMAIINFICLNIGTSSYRLKEIGLRKVFGSRKKQLILQFMTEAWILTLLAALLSLAGYQMLRPFFDAVLNTSLPAILEFSGISFLALSGLVGIIGLMAGIYPAFIMSSSNVVNAIKGKADTAKGGVYLRKSMLILQFTLAILVFIIALNVSRQISFVFNKDLGYHKEQVLVLGAYPKQWDSVGVSKMENIKKSLLQLPAIKSASLSFEIPERKPPVTIGLLPYGKGGNQPFMLSSINADEDYARTFGLEVKEGSFFYQTGTFISGQIVLNESAVKALGLTPGEATGKQIEFPSAKATLTVAGVVKDYHYSSLHNQIEPLAFTHVKDGRNYRYLTVKLNTPAMADAVEAIRQKWRTISPSAPFEYFFMDDKFQSLYQSELQLKKAAGIATVLNLVIVFLGIIGVVAFTLTRRSREMAVRKVLGAKVPDILSLFIKDYAWLILISNLVAWPLAWLLTDKWLEGYVYRIRQDIGPYLYVGVFIFAAAFIIISMQCLKSARANPVRDLRAE